jgi:hypothetical protein
LPDIHRAAAAKLRLSVDLTMVELAKAHEQVALSPVGGCATTRASSAPTHPHRSAA